MWCNRAIHIKMLVVVFVSEWKPAQAQRNQASLQWNLQSFLTLIFLLSTFQCCKLALPAMTWFHLLPNKATATLTSLLFTPLYHLQIRLSWPPQTSFTLLLITSIKLSTLGLIYLWARTTNSKWTSQISFSAATGLPRAHQGPHWRRRWGREGGGQGWGWSWRSTLPSKVASPPSFALTLRSGGRLPCCYHHLTATNGPVGTHN